MCLSPSKNWKPLKLNAYLICCIYLNLAMESPNLFISELAIWNWFAARTASLEAEQKNFNHCGKVSFNPCILDNPCIYCIASSMS